MNRYPKYEKRLIGTWISDKKKTKKELRARNDIISSKKLEALFGKLKIKYGRKYIRTELNDHKTKNQYRVLAADYESVAILVEEEQPLIFHIHFEGEYYWICLGKFREYFKKV